MFLLPKRDRVIKVENDSSIRSLEQPKLELVETDCLEQNNDVMTGCFSPNSQPIGQT